MNFLQDVPANSLRLMTVSVSGEKPITEKGKQFPNEISGQKHSSIVGTTFYHSSKDIVRLERAS